MVQHAAFGIGAAIVDPDSDFPASCGRADRSNGSERQCPVSRRELMHIVSLTVGSPISVESRSVPGSHSSLDVTDGVARKIGRLRRTATSDDCGCDNKSADEGR